MSVHQGSILYRKIITNDRGQLGYPDAVQPSGVDLSLSLAYHKRATKLRCAAFRLYPLPASFARHSHSVQRISRWSCTEQRRDAGIPNADFSVVNYRTVSEMQRPERHEYDESSSSRPSPPAAHYPGEYPVGSIRIASVASIACGASVVCVDQPFVHSTPLASRAGSTMRCDDLALTIRAAAVPRAGS